MSEQVCTKKQAQAGFTLVELAIVMIIIGLLIGGVLQGQQMIANARVTSTVAELEAFEAAMVSFDDMYGELPGDIAAPDDRIPDCAGAPCSNAGDENGEIGDGDPSIALGATELSAVGPQLMAAGLLAGDPGGQFFASIQDVTIVAGFNDGGAPTGDRSGGEFEEAHYVVTRNEDGEVASTGALRPVEAQQIDAKLDDGDPAAGGVLALGAAACVSGGNYQGSDTDPVCNIGYEVLR